MNFEGTGAICAPELSGSWVTTKPMYPCDACLDEDITLGIPTKNTASSHRLALPTLREGCEPLRKHAPSTTAKLISTAGVTVPDKNNVVMSAVGWAYALLVFSIGRTGWGLPALCYACGCHLLWLGSTWMNCIGGWKCRRERTAVICRALLRYSVQFTAFCCLAPVSVSTKERRIKCFPSRNFEAWGKISRREERRKTLDGEGKGREDKSNWVAVNAEKLGENQWGMVKEKAGHTAPLEGRRRRISSTWCSS